MDIQEDITEKRRAEEKIDWLARHDVLTEVANRHQFCEALDSSTRGLEDGYNLPCIGSTSIASKKSTTRMVILLEMHCFKMLQVDSARLCGGRI